MRKSIARPVAKNTEYMAPLAELARELGGYIDLEQATSLVGGDAEVAEIQLRKLSARGWLTMTKLYNEDGSFGRFVWKTR